ncbi:MAG: hypothetical protein CML88_00640 [Rhodobiaceae bacterium]|nr:hypothetical protein [Rhodobiaceae bacterium]
MLIFTLIGLWVGSGYLGDESENKEVAENNIKVNEFAVKYIESSASDFTDTFKIIGKTEADSIVELSMQTNGKVENIYFNKGQNVLKGQTICALETQNKYELLEAARANLNDTKLKYESQLKLAKKSFVSENSLNSLEANYEKAKADYRNAELNKEYLNVRAPIDGIINDINIEVGELATKGEICAVLMDSDPIIVKGNVSEKNISKLKIDSPAKIQLIGETFLEGKINYISSIADPDTRTFTVEVAIENPDNQIKVGTTAEIFVSNQIKDSHLIPSSILSLSDDGNIGIKIISKDNMVEFIEVKVSNLNNEGAYVTDLPPTIRIITVGQDFVTSGDIVNAVQDVNG